MADFETMRRMMVDGQVRPSDVTDPRLIDAMLACPRERFFPAVGRAMAYFDMDGTVGHPADGVARRLLKPMVLAKLIHALDLEAADRVLDVGCMTGYSSALLSRLAGPVVALEKDQTLAREAKNVLAELGHDTVKVVRGPLIDGYQAAEPYDAILINGATEVAPEALCRQLRDGGRLICILGRGPGGKATLYRKDQGEISARALFDASAQVLPGFAKPAAFVF